MLVVIAAATIAGFAPSAALRIVPRAMAQAQEPALVGQARQIFGQIRDGKYGEATALWDAKMQEGLPAAKVEEFWVALLGQVGELKTIGSGTITEMGAYKRVSFPLTFANAELTGNVVFDAAGKVAGLNIVPKQ